MKRAVMWGLVVLVCLVSVGWAGAAPASAINTYPQVNSKTLASGKDTLEWGDRYQINVCDSHHRWRSMTLWVRASASSAWTKVGRTTKVNDTSTWPQSPARCRYFAAFEWTVNKPDRGFGTVIFGYGTTKPEYRFSGIVRNKSGSPSPPVPVPSAPPAPSAQGRVVADGGTATNTALTTFWTTLLLGRTVTIWTCTNEADYSPYRGVLYVRGQGGAWRSVANGVFTPRSGDCTDPMYPVKVQYTWRVDTPGTVNSDANSPYPVVQLGARLGRDASSSATPASIWGYAVVWPDGATCRAANVSGC
ncbi:MAG: hypothetical protein GC156_14925 [Actinomycetales bacterium]|nr:hypothetical protein [Actinomycetales bacterium]